VARLGGDEFVIILEGLRAESEVERVGKSIVDEIGRPFDIGGELLNVTTSIGIAFESKVEASETAQSFLKRADASLYVAKTAGRNSYHVSGAEASRT